MSQVCRVCVLARKGGLPHTASLMHTDSGKREERGTGPSLHQHKMGASQCTQRRRPCWARQTAAERCCVWLLLSHVFLFLLPLLNSSLPSSLLLSRRLLFPLSCPFLSSVFLLPLHLLFSLPSSPFSSFPPFFPYFPCPFLSSCFPLPDPVVYFLVFPFLPKLFFPVPLSFSPLLLSSHFLLACLSPSLFLLYLSSSSLLLSSHFFLAGISPSLFLYLPLPCCSPLFFFRACLFLSLFLYLPLYYCFKSANQVTLISRRRGEYYVYVYEPFVSTPNNGCKKNRRLFRGQVYKWTIMSSHLLQAVNLQL